jgi:branched-chain amino acid transport system substrate-binding protein
MSGAGRMWAGVLLAALAGCGPRGAPEPVWIGQVVPLTGSDRAAGEHARQGVQLAVAEAKAEGKAIAGRPLAVVHADSRSDLEAVGAETVRLLSVNRVAALLAGPEDPAAERLLRADGSYGVPVVVPGELADPSSWSVALALGALPGERGRALARYAIRDLAARRAVVLSDARDPVAAALAAAFVREWRRGKDGSPAGLAVEEWTVGGSADLPGLAARAVKARPDLVLFAGASADFRTLRGRLGEGSLHAPLLYGGGDAGPAAVQGGLEGGPDLYLATVYATEKLTAHGQEFARRYEAGFHESPDLYAAGAYDGARLLFDVLHRAQTTAPAALRDELARTESFETVTGTVAWKDRRPRRTFFLVEVKGGQVRVVQTVEPGGE